MSFDRQALIFRGRIFCEIAHEAQAGFKPIFSEFTLHLKHCRHHKGKGRGKGPKRDKDDDKEEEGEEPAEEEDGKVEEEVEEEEPAEEE